MVLVAVSSRNADCGCMMSFLNGWRVVQFLGNSAEFTYSENEISVSAVFRQVCLFR